MNHELIGKSLIFAGVILVVIGVIFLLAQKFPWLGRLPGDIYIQKKNFSFYFPITTSLVASIIISLVIILLGRR